MFRQCEFGQCTVGSKGTLNEDCSQNVKSNETIVSSGNVMEENSPRQESYAAIRNKRGKLETKKYRGTNICQLPPEILLKIFSEFSPADLSRTVAPVCRSWRTIAHDHTLWKEVVIKGMKYPTERLADLIRSKPRLRTISLIGRMDLNPILSEIIQYTTGLESLTLHHCGGAPNRSNVQAKIMVKLLKKLKELKSINIEDTEFRSCTFYRILLPKISKGIKNLRMIVRPSKKEWKVLSNSQHVHNVKIYGHNQNPNA